MTAKTTTPSIRITNGALDESDLRGGTVILRGVIDKDSLKHLRVDDYQREALPLSSISGLIAAVQQGDALPDIEIGMRGTRCTGRGDDYFLGDQCFIIDGQQRVNAALTAIARSPEIAVRLGAMIHFDTTRQWEMERFRILNSLQNKVSPNVLLKNMRETNPALASLYGLSTNDKAFVLYNRVSWGQSMKRSDLTSALTIAKITNRLHSHKSFGKSGQLREVVRQLEQIGAAVGNGNVRANVKTFFDIVDASFGIKLVQYREMAPYLRAAFLITLAQVFSDHFDFWQDDEAKKLFVDIDMRRKLALFPLTDPNIAGLITGGAKGGGLLYQLIVNHLNKGKRSRHLQARRPAPMVDNDEVEEAEAA